MRIKLMLLLFLLALVGSCSAGSRIKLNLVEQGEPVRNAEIAVQQGILCEMGSECNPPVLFEGKTDSEGAIYLDSELLWGNNILVEGYYVKTFHRGLKETEPYNVYDENIIIIDNREYDLRRQKEIVVSLKKIK